MWRIYYLYLRLLLFIGHRHKAFQLAQQWGRELHRDRHMAAWKTQAVLPKYGFHKCPCCEWATREPEEHLRDPNTWCAERNNAVPLTGD